MRAYVNELALAEACSVAVPEQRPLLALLEGRHCHPALASALYCTKAMPLTRVREGVQLRDLAQQLARDQKRMFFAWTDKGGPFVEDDRQPVELDLFVFGEDEIEVTERGLGEAARRILCLQAACVHSPVEDPESRFAANPLLVVQGLRDDAINHIDVPNFLSATALAEAVQADWPDPTNWAEALAQARQRFDRLLIGKHCDTVLSKETFRLHQNRRLRELFAVLQSLMEQMGEGGGLSAKGQALRGKYFVGARAWFSNESESNQRDRARYTFPDPAGTGKLLCFWHGKIGSDAWRMYFEWPPADPSGRLRVVYIGPHL